MNQSLLSEPNKLEYYQMSQICTIVNPKLSTKLKSGPGLRPTLKFHQVHTKWPIEFGKFTVNIGLNCGFVKFTGGEGATQCGQGRIYNRQSFDADGSNFYFSPRLLMIARGQGVNFCNQSPVITLITPTSNICSKLYQHHWRQDYLGLLPGGGKYWTRRTSLEWSKPKPIG